MNRHEDILSALNWRYAVKKYDSSKKITQEDWQVLLQSLVLAPSSYGLQPWKFFVIQNEEIRAQLRPESWNQSQITDAAGLIVFATKEKLTEKDVQDLIDSTAHQRNIPSSHLDGYKKMLLSNVVQGLSAEACLAWNQRQAYIAMGFLLETAALLKIDATPLEGLNPKAYDRILNLEKQGLRTVAAVALGYRHAEDSYQGLKKVRYPLNEVVQYI